MPNNSQEMSLPARSVKPNGEQRNQRCASVSSTKRSRLRANRDELEKTRRARQRVTKQRFVLEHTGRTTAAIDARRDERDLSIALIRQNFTEDANERNRHRGARQRGLRLMAAKRAMV